MQEKESPLPTQVPPFTQGLGTQLLFLAVGRERGLLVMPGQTPTWLGRAACLGRVLTDGTGATLPAWRARAAEGVAAVVACAAVAAGVGVTLELACKRTTSQWAGSGGGRPLHPPARSLAHSQGPQALTRVAGLALPAIVTGTVEVVDQVIAAAAAVAGVGEAVVGIWGEDAGQRGSPALGRASRRRARAGLKHVGAWDSTPRLQAHARAGLSGTSGWSQALARVRQSR